MGIKSYRHCVDKIDKAIVKLLAKRFKVAVKIAKYKARHQMTVYQMTREAEKKEMLYHWGKKYKIDPNFLSQMWNYIMGESIKRQEKIMDEKK